MIYERSGVLHTARERSKNHYFLSPWLRISQNDALEAYILYPESCSRIVPGQKTLWYEGIFDYRLMFAMGVQSTHFKMTFCQSLSIMRVGRCNRVKVIRSCESFYLLANSWFPPLFHEVKNWQTFYRIMSHEAILKNLSKVWIECWWQMMSFLR